MRHNYSLKKLKSSPGAKTITHAALEFSAYVSNVTKKQEKSEILYCTKYQCMRHNYSLKKLKSSPRAQTITHSALKFSAYVSNVTKKAEKGVTIMH